MVGDLNDLATAFQIRVGTLQIGQCRKYIPLVVIGMLISFSARAVEIYWADEIGIHRTDPDAENMEAVVFAMDVPKTPPAIVVDSENRKIYWTNMNTIWRANLNGTDVENIIKMNDRYQIPHEIALDISGRKLYWIYGRAVYRANLDGTNTELILIDLERYFYRGTPSTVGCSTV